MRGGKSYTTLGIYFRSVYNTIFKKSTDERSRKRTLSSLYILSIITATAYMSSVQVFLLQALMLYGSSALFIIYSGALSFAIGRILQSERSQSIYRAYIIAFIASSSRFILHVALVAFIKSLLHYTRELLEFVTRWGARFVTRCNELALRILTVLVAHPLTAKAARAVLPVSVLQLVGSVAADSFSVRGVLKKLIWGYLFALLFVPLGAAVVEKMFNQLIIWVVLSNYVSSAFGPSISFGLGATAGSQIWPYATSFFFLYLKHSFYFLRFTAYTVFNLTLRFPLILAGNLLYYTLTTGLFLAFSLFYYTLSYTSDFTLHAFFSIFNLVATIGIVHPLASMGMLLGFSIAYFKNYQDIYNSLAENIWTAPFVAMLATPLLVGEYLLSKLIGEAKLNGILDTPAEFLAKRVAKEAVAPMPSAPPALSSSSESSTVVAAVLGGGEASALTAFEASKDAGDKQERYPASAPPVQKLSGGSVERLAAA